MTKIQTAAIALGLTLALTLGVFGAKPGSEPPVEPTSRFACFTTHPQGLDLCLDKGFKYMVYQLDASSPHLSRIIMDTDATLGAQAVLGSVAEVAEALSAP